MAQPGSTRLDRFYLFAVSHSCTRRLQRLGSILQLRLPVARRYRWLIEYMRVPKAVYCVQHDYHPKETIKMDGAAQISYPRKNWSSLMLFNCDPPSVEEPHSRRCQSRERCLSPPHAMGDGRRYRRTSDGMELARRMERETASGNAEGCSFYPRRTLGSSNGRTSTTAIFDARNEMP